jgi:4-hydroxy-3-polyprenylbenzoate decarboxylase
VVHVTGPVDHLDHSSYEQFFGGKLGIDATAKLPTGGYHRDGGWPEECVLDHATVDLVERRWAEYGVSSR